MQLAIIISDLEKTKIKLDIFANNTDMKLENLITSSIEKVNTLNKNVYDLDTRLNMLYEIV